MTRVPKGRGVEPDNVGPPGATLWALTHYLQQALPIAITLLSRGSLHQPTGPWPADTNAAHANARDLDPPRPTKAALAQPAPKEQNQPTGP